MEGTSKTRIYILSLLSIMIIILLVFYTMSNQKMKEKFDDVFFPHDESTFFSLRYQYDNESGVYTVTVKSIVDEDQKQKSISYDHVYVNLHFGFTPETEQNTRDYERHTAGDFLEGREIIVKNLTDLNASERGPNDIINVSIDLKFFDHEHNGVMNKGDYFTIRIQNIETHEIGLQDYFFFYIGSHNSHHGGIFLPGLREMRDKEMNQQDNLPKPGEESTSGEDTWP